MDIVLVMALAIATVVASIAVTILRFRHLFASREEAKRTQLADECFSGLPEVVVSPRAWRLSDYDVRLMAARRGYREVAPPGPHVLAFRHQPDAVPRPVHHGTQQARDRVTADITTHGFAWLSLSDVGGTVPDVVAFAARHGARVLRQCGDHLDPTLLVGTQPISSLRDLIPTDAGTPLTSRQRIYTRAGANVAAAAAMVVLLTLAVETSNALLLTLAVLVLLGADRAVYLLFSARGSTTERMTRLLREFETDAKKVVIVKRHYGLNRLTILDVAAEFGYTHWKLGVQRPTTRWYEECLVFEPRAAVGHR